MIIHVFGATTPVGSSFINILKEKGYENIIQYSRNADTKEYTYCDMSKPYEFKNNIFSEKSLIVSFSPIWVFSDFLLSLSNINPKIFKNIEKMIICSSSSVLTKRFAFNSFDKNLYLKLKRSEINISKLCISSQIKYKIVQPSMVYGSFGKYKDKNFSKLLILMRYLPFLILPINTGLRQPINCYQLADVFYNLISKERFFGKYYASNLLIGGDEILTFDRMLLGIKNSTNKNDFARYCLFIKVPDLFFVIITLPIAFLSIKSYESLLRIFANLSDFTFQSEITNNKRSKICS